MRIFFAGATGFVGRRVVSRLLREKHEIVALTRDPQKARAEKRMPENVTLIQGDLTRRADWMQALDGCEAVINLTGEQAVGRRWTAERREKIYASRVTATENIVAAIGEAKTRPTLLINASAAGYYGDSLQSELSEEAPAGDDQLAHLCVQWENAATKAETLGVRVVMLRLGVVLHESGGVLKTLTPIFRLGLGGPLGNGLQGFPWIHLEDVCGIIAFLLSDNSINGPLNLVAPETVSNKQFSRMLGKILRRPALLPVPALALKLLYGQGAEGLLHGSRPIPAKLLKAGYRFHYPTLRSALEAEFPSIRASY